MKKLVTKYVVQKQCDGELMGYPYVVDDIEDLVDEIRDEAESIEKSVAENEDLKGCIYEYRVSHFNQVEEDVFKEMCKLDK